MSRTHPGYKLNQRLVPWRFRAQLAGQASDGRAAGGLTGHHIDPAPGRFGFAGGPKAPMPVMQGQATARCRRWGGRRIQTFSEGLRDAG